MSNISNVKLNNGVEIPIIGTGAYAPPDPENPGKIKEWILETLKNGFRHIDTAWCYGTEGAVGEAIRASGIPREEIFVTTKLHLAHHDRVAWSFEDSLKNLGLDYVDLYLIHWPLSLAYDSNAAFPKNSDGTYKLNDSVSFTESWAEVEKLLDTGKVKAIGVSNFSIKTLDALLKTAKVIPAINQVELHPYLTQEDLREYCAAKGIAIQAYTPSGYAPVRADPVINDLAKKYGVTPNQITLSWHVARGIIILPKSVNSTRQKENLSVITLSEEDVAAISKLDRNQRLCNKPDANGVVFGWSAERLGWN